ncbi:beta-microseminoprotein-like [Haliotis rufescens]|uniref:beta-microseminoprotein-like n=1 Tax=Haliotis rufescens TaxID=6454 RepID=UPI00201F6DD3|nr:beta-microseminoprotein-like [Haliotis rufescens]
MYVYGLLLLGLVASAESFCFVDKVYTDVSKYGSITQYCMYKGLKMQVGSHLKTADCIECNCNDTGLGCCGFGIKAGVVQPPPGCKVVADGCKMLLVKADDDTKDCSSGESLIKP